jgi:hypothetical protein
MLRSPSPSVFSSSREKISSTSAGDAGFVSNDSLKRNPRHHSPAPPVFQERGANTDLSRDPLSSHTYLSVSTSDSSPPSLSILPASSSLPQHIPRSSCLSFTKPCSSISLHKDDVLSQGDIVGEGIPLQGESLRLVPRPNQSTERAPVANNEQVALEFEVIRKLGTGSCAVVYLVREVLSRSSPSEDNHIYPFGHPDLGNSASTRPETKYAREYTIKLISKADLDEEELLSVLTEVCLRNLSCFSPMSLICCFPVLYSFLP